MAKNTDLSNAKSGKNDEFYTDYNDIEKEVINYIPFFKGKKVYCNCDNARESNFAKYFIANFKKLGLDKLIVTGYNDNGNGTLFVYNGNDDIDLDNIQVTNLNGNGDFRSEECVEFLKECDVVVTNPPFSLFREYIAQLMEYGKKFLIIGNMNAITYKEVFPLIKNDKLWLGPSITSGDRKFYVPDDYPLQAAGCGIDENGRRYIKVKGVRWFTNLDHEKRNRPLELCKQYSNECYPKYDNYNAINVDKTSDIPMGYNGVMGVPISFLDKYCPDQFEIVGNEYMLNISKGRGYVNGKRMYSRIFIRYRK